MNITTIKFLDKYLGLKAIILLRIFKSKKTFNKNPKSIYELAKFAKRDYGNVYRDVEILKNLDLIEIKDI